MQRHFSLFNEYQITLKQLYRFYTNSAVRYNELRGMQVVMDDDDMQLVTLKEPASFRWLSLEAAVKAVSDVYPALHAALEHEAAKGSPEAKGLLSKVKNVSFVLTTAFLCDILAVLGKLSKVFQRSSIDIDTVNMMLDSTFSKLDSFKSNNGRELTKAYELTSNGIYRGVKIQDKQHARMQFQHASTDYLDAAVANLEARFQKDSMNTLQLLNSVLNPACVPRDSTISVYGLNALQELGDLYGGDAGIVDSGRMEDDFFQFKVVLKSLVGASLKEAYVTISSKYSEMFPDFSVLAKVLLVSPMTSVACERGFSSHNRIKVKGRARLNHSTVTKLMRVMEEGPSLADFDPKPSVANFLKLRNRRK